MAAAVSTSSTTLNPREQHIYSDVLEKYALKLGIITSKSDESALTQQDFINLVQKIDEWYTSWGESGGSRILTDDENSAFKRIRDRLWGQRNIIDDPTDGGLSKDVKDALRPILKPAPAADTAIVVAPAPGAAAVTPPPVPSAASKEFKIKLELYLDERYPMKVSDCVTVTLDRDELESRRGNPTEFQKYISDKINDKISARINGLSRSNPRRYNSMSSGGFALCRDLYSTGSPSLEPKNAIRHCSELSPDKTYSIISRDRVKRYEADEKRAAFAAGLEKHTAARLGEIDVSPFMKFLDACMTEVATDRTLSQNILDIKRFYRERALMAFPDYAGAVAACHSDPRVHGLLFAVYSATSPAFQRAHPMPGLTARIVEADGPTHRGGGSGRSSPRASASVFGGGGGASGRSSPKTEEVRGQALYNSPKAFVEGEIARLRADVNKDGSPKNPSKIKAFNALLVNKDFWAGNQPTSAGATALIDEARKHNPDASFTFFREIGDSTSLKNLKAQAWYADLEKKSKDVPIASSID